MQTDRHFATASLRICCIIAALTFLVLSVPRNQPVRCLVNISAHWSTPPVEQTSVRPREMTCSSRKPGHSLTDEASMLLLQLSGTLFLFICARHSSVEDNSELGWKQISSTKPTPVSENDLFKSELTFSCHWTVILRFMLNDQWRGHLWSSLP